MTGVRLAESKGRSLAPLMEEEESFEKTRKFQYLIEILKWRSQSTPDHALFSQVGTKVSFPEAVFVNAFYKFSLKTLTMYIC